MSFSPISPLPRPSTSLPTHSYDEQVNATFDHMCTSEAWKFYTQLTLRAFSSEVLHALRSYNNANPHVRLSDHIPLLLQIVHTHVQLALKETSGSTMRQVPAHIPKRMAFKKRSLSLRPPVCSTPPPTTIPEHEELTDAVRGPGRAATAGNASELYGPSTAAELLGAFEALADPNRHTISSGWASATTESFRELARPRPLPHVATTIEIPNPLQPSNENSNTTNQQHQPFNVLDGFLRTKSSWRAKPQRRNSLRNVAYSIGPIAALREKRERKRVARGKSTPQPGSTSQAQAHVTSRDV